MVGCVEEELRCMRNGLHDVIPSELLVTLSPEVREIYTKHTSLFFFGKFILQIFAVFLGFPAPSIRWYHRYRHLETTRFNHLY